MDHQASQPPSSPRRLPSRRMVLGAALAAGAVGGVGALGGLWVGMRLGARRRPPPAGAPGSLRPNAWLQVEPSGLVTIWVAKSEMGQGVHTALAQIVADQLACPFASVRVLQAPTDLNTFGWQGTFTSSSVKDSWHTLESAGAAARELLVEAAAEALSVPKDQCRAQDGHVVHGASGRRISYGDLAEAAAALGPRAKGQVVRPAERAERGPGALLGQSPPRVDTFAKTTGQARFGVDVRWPGMWFAAVARCPFWNANSRHPFTRGRPLRWNREAALAVPGVRAVEEFPFGIAVLADHTHAALSGRAALQVEWDQTGRAEQGTAELLEALAGLARDPSAKAIEAELRGDAGAALAGGGRTHRAEYSLPYLAHVTMEPMNASARPVPGGLQVAAPVQNPHGARDAAAAAAGLAPEQVEVLVTYLGGGFGRRAEQDVVEEVAALAARFDRPVQVFWDRSDDLAMDFHRPAAHHVLEAALDGDGLPTAWRHRIATQSIVAQRVPLNRPVDPTAVEGAVELAYELGARHVVWVPAELPVRVGFWRSVGHSHTAFAVESFIDELAELCGLDGYAYRRRLLAKRPRELALLDRVANAIAWDSAPPPGLARAIAFHTSFGSHVALALEAGRTEGGAVRLGRIVVGVDCGQIVHPDLIRAQMEGGVLFALSAALFEHTQFERGQVANTDLARYPILRLRDAPSVEVLIAPSGDPPGGIGEVAVPPLAPALVTALRAVDGHRRRSLPLSAPA